MATLYYSPGACSLSPHIVAKESGSDIKIEKVDLATKKTSSGGDFIQVNPKGQVPVLKLDSGEILTEGPVIVQYLADQKNAIQLFPKSGSMERIRVQEWLNFITSELHKGFSPLFNPEFPQDAKKIVIGNLNKKFAHLDQHLAKRDYLTGDQFTIADAYCFTVVNWSNFVNLDLTAYPHLKAYLARVAARPKVQEALKAEGLLQ